MLASSSLGGLEQLEELRRPWIDRVPIHCELCGEPVERIPEVGDVWLDAGIVPFATLGWENPQWVEEGIAPKRIIGTKYIGDKPANGVAFTRPMCPYPQRAQYRGSGATTDAANFVCVGDESDSNGPIIADFGKRETILGYAALLFQ